MWGSLTRYRIMSTTYTTTVRDCEVTVSLSCDANVMLDDEDSFPGTGTTTFQREDIERLEDGCEWHTENGGGDSVSTDVIQEALEEMLFDPEDDKWTLLHVTTADYAISLLFMLCELGKPFSVEFESEGSAFWFFHDLGHVAQDAQEYGPGAVYFNGISAEAEDAAHVYGARLALKSGACDLGEVLRETVGVQKVHRERFDRESDAVADILTMVSAALGVSLAEQLSEAL